MKYGCLRFPDGEVSCSRLRDTTQEPTMMPYHIGNDFPGRATHKGPLDELRVCIEADSDDEAITTAQSVFTSWDARPKEWVVLTGLTSNRSPWMGVYEVAPAQPIRVRLRNKPGAMVVQAHCYADAREVASRLLEHTVAMKPPAVPVQATLFTI